MEHRTDSSSTQSHGCLVMLVLLGVLLAAFACSPAPYRPITGKHPAPAPPPISDEQWAEEKLRVPFGALSQGRMRGVPHIGPKPEPGPDDYYVGEYMVHLVHRLDHCDRLVGADPWSLRYFPTVKAAKAKGYHVCTYCIYPNYR